MNNSLKSGRHCQDEGSTKHSKKVKELLYSTFQGNEATRYGMEMKDITGLEYTTHQEQMGHLGLAGNTCLSPL